jgi:TatD DNase family protein
VADDESWRGQIAPIPAFFSRTATDGPCPVALGEIGLDRFHLPKDSVAAETIYVRQQAVFRAQLAFAREWDCPIVIHSRDSFADCVRLLDESGVNWTRVVFHCFGHGPDEIRILRERGGRASFTGIITYKNADTVRAALVAQGIETLMVETDSPYLAPVPHRGKPNEPAYVTHIAQAAARLLNLSDEELAARAMANSREFFGLV